MWLMLPFCRVDKNKNIKVNIFIEEIQMVKCYHLGDDKECKEKILDYFRHNLKIN